MPAIIYVCAPRNRGQGGGASKAQIMRELTHATHPVAAHLALGAVRIEHTHFAVRYQYKVTLVSMGNPHCVVFRDPDNLNLEELGKKFENNPAFPERINTEFVKVIKRSSLTYKWLHDKSIPTIINYIKLADYFDCSIDYLLGREQ